MSSNVNPLFFKKMTAILIYVAASYISGWQSLTHIQIPLR